MLVHLPEIDDLFALLLIDANSAAVITSKLKTVQFGTVYDVMTSCLKFTFYNYQAHVHRIF